MNNLPRIRFKGFSEGWEQRKLGDLGSFKNGMNFSKDAMDKGYPFVNLQNIFGKNVIDIENLGLAEATDNQLKEYNLQEGDVLFVRSSVKLEGVGEAAVVPKNLEKTTYSGFVIRFRDEVDMDKNFKRFVFGTNPIRNQIMAKATNSANKNISQDVLNNLEVYLPVKDEQRKIGAYFEQLDNLITLHQRKCEEIQKVKIFMLQQMFPQKGEKAPKIRFIGFTDAWEQRKLGEISDKVTKKNQDIAVEEVFTNSAEFGIISQRDFFDKDIANAENIDGYYVVEPDDFVYNPRISTTAPFGPIKRNKLERTGAMSPLYYVFRPHDIDLSYLEWFFQTTCWHAFMRFNGNSGARSDRFAITDKIFNEMPISMPQDIEEQKKLGLYFTELDNLITLHQRKRDEIQRVKKYMLQNMFPQN